MARDAAPSRLMALNVISYWERYEPPTHPSSRCWKIKPKNSPKIVRAGGSYVNPNMVSPKDRSINTGQGSESSHHTPSRRLLRTPLPTRGRSKWVQRVTHRSEMENDWRR